MDQQPQPPEQPRDYGIDMQTLKNEWETAQTNRKHYTNDFPELDNIVDAVPLNHEDKAPFVGDTTLAGLVRSIPRSSVQQLPIFAAIINGTKNSIMAQVGSWILRKCVFNEDTFGKGLLSTVQVGSEQALTHGYAPFMCSASMNHSDFGTTMKLLHYDDVDPEPGIQDANEAGYFYVVANLTKSRVRKIRDAASENEGTSWNVPALDRLLEMQPESKRYSIYQSSARKNQQEDNAQTYTFVTRYETGKKARFVTFCPQIDDEPLRVINNKSKFGYPRVQFLVIDPAPLSPFGVSRVRLASPNQNLMNAYYQNVASMFILNSDPPLLKRGRFAKPVQLKRRAVWETIDQNATVELKEMSNSSLQTFVPMAQQMAAQIQNMMGGPVGNVNGGANALGYSKTGPGVKAQREDRDLTTNQITNIMENFLRQYALVALDTYIAERTREPEIDPITQQPKPNEDTIIVDDAAKDAINRIGEDQFKPTEEQPVYIPIVGDDNKFVIDWNKFYDAVEHWSVEIELSVSKDELDEKKRGDMQDMLVTLMQNADPNDMETRQKIRELQDRLLEKSVPESQRLGPAPPPAPIVPQPGEIPVEGQPQMTVNQ